MYAVPSVFRVDKLLRGEKPSTPESRCRAIGLCCEVNEEPVVVQSPWYVVGSHRWRVCAFDGREYRVIGRHATIDAAMVQARLEWQDVQRMREHLWQMEYSPDVDDPFSD